MDDEVAKEVFTTGSHRDNREGKGRYDLIPWGVAGQISVQLLNVPLLSAHHLISRCFSLLAAWLDNRAAWQDLVPVLCMLTVMEYGHTEALACGYLPPDLLERWALLMERGAGLYGDRNWEKGQPLCRFFDSGMRHFIKYLRGDDDEDHFIAIFFNLGAIIYFKDDPDLDDRLPNNM